MFRIVLTLLFILMFLPSTLWAQSNNPAYMVKDVKVDIVAETSVKARNQAFAAAETQAFKMLAERFLDAGQLASFVPPSADIIAGMVSDFEITNEQFSKKRYLGTYLFRFKEIPVYRFFGHGPIGSFDSASTGNKLLIIPSFSQNGQTSLWDVNKNPWLQAWQKQPAETIPNLLIPQGNVSDTMDLRETQPDKFSQSALKRMRARYNVNEIAVVSAVFDQKAKNILVINIYRTDRGKIELVQALPVTVGKATKLGELLNSAIPQVETILAGSWRGQSLSPEPSSSAAVPLEALPPATQAVPAAAQPSPVAYTPQAGQVKATARFATMGDWLSMRRSLNGIPPLREIRIMALTTNQATMQFTYSDWMALTSALNARGLSLQSIGPGDYNLVKIAGATGYTP